jgi:Ca2+-dependent lipid-binding protein
LDPVWEEAFDFDITDPKTDVVKLAVYDYDKYSTNDFLGESSLTVLSVVNCGSEVCRFYASVDRVD